VNHFRYFINRDLCISIKKATDPIIIDVQLKAWILDREALLGQGND